MLKRGIAPIAVIAAVVTLTGCSEPNQRAGPATTGPSAGPAETFVEPTARPVESSTEPSARTSKSVAASEPVRPSARGATPAVTQPGNAPRRCQMSDLRFWLSLSLPMAGPYASGSVHMSNTSADRCRVSGSINVRWLDSGGGTMPITVEQLPGSMPGYTTVLEPGRGGANAGIEWRRSRAMPSDSDVLCPPAPAWIEARLAAETTWARMAWTPKEGLCDMKAGARPIERTP